MHERVAIAGNKSVAARIKALAAEHCDDPEMAIRHWQTASNRLRVDIRLDKNHTAISLKAALVLRHTVELYERVFGSDNKAIEDLLLDSLDYDETDKPTYLKLLAFYRAYEAVNEYRKMLDRSVKQFPEDTDILLMSSDTLIMLSREEVITTSSNSLEIDCISNINCFVNSSGLSLISVV